MIIITAAAHATMLCVLIPASFKRFDLSMPTMPPQTAAITTRSISSSTWARVMSAPNALKNSI
jgi:hypothetical protein